MRTVSEGLGFVYLVVTGQTVTNIQQTHTVQDTNSNRSFLI